MTTQKFDLDRIVAEHEVGHAIVGLALGWQVGEIRTTRDGTTAGSCAVSPPDGRDGLQVLLEEAMVKIAGPLSAGTAGGLDHSSDIRRFAEIINQIAYSEAEARHLRNWICRRTRAMLETPRARGVAAELRKRLTENGGEIDLNWPGRQDSTQPVAPIVNVTVPPANVYVTVEPSPNKIVQFERDYQGQLVSATTMDAEEPDPGGRGAERRMTSRFEEYRESSGRLALALREPVDEVDALGTVYGMGLAYGSWATIASKAEGHFLERFQVGSLSKTIADRGPKIRLLFNHGHDHVVGDRPLGGPLQLVSDQAGLHYEAPLFDTTYARDLLPSLRSNLLGASVRFAVIADRYASNPKRSQWNPTGLPERTIIEARLAELSLTPFPAYDSSSAGIRSSTDRYTLRYTLA